MHLEMSTVSEREMTIVAAERLTRSCNSSAELLRAYREEGDLSARERLIEAYIPLVVSIARPYANRGERLEDLVQVGSIGLIKAVDRFEPDREVQFAAFAIPNILGEIKRHLRDRCGAMRIPRRYQEASVRVRTTRTQLTADLCRDPTSSELAAAAELDQDELAETLRAEQARAPLTLADASNAARPQDDFDATDDRLAIESGMRSLDLRERQALGFRYFGDLQQSEIAARLGVSQTHASRLIASGLAKLHDDFEGDLRCADSEKPLNS
jgi:RNA polymerase sigma-B factor